jgi:Zn-finger nucleic acid-binding protein
MEKQVIVEAFNCPNCGAAIPPDSPSCSYCGSSVATRLCPACYGAVSIGMRHCPHCGAEVINSNPQEAVKLRCPRCETNLHVYPMGKNSLNGCTQCGGLWVSKSVFQAICTRQEEQEAVLGFEPEHQQTPVAQEQKTQRTYIPCPECGKLMNRKNFSGSGIVLDWCRDHGSWFDRGELQRIVQFIRDGGLKKARERELLELKDQEERLRMQEFTMAARERWIDSSTSVGLDHGFAGDLLSDFLAKMFR